MFQDYDDITNDQDIISVKSILDSIHDSYVNLRGDLKTRFDIQNSVYNSIVADATSGVDVTDRKNSLISNVNSLATDTNAYLGSSNIQTVQAQPAQVATVQDASAKQDKQQSSPGLPNLPELPALQTVPSAQPKVSVEWYKDWKVLAGIGLLSIVGYYGYKSYKKKKSSVI